MVIKKYERDYWEKTLIDLRNTLENSQSEEIREIMRAYEEFETRVVNVMNRGAKVYGDDFIVPIELPDTGEFEPSVNVSNPLFAERDLTTTSDRAQKAHHENVQQISKTTLHGKEKEKS